MEITTYWAVYLQSLPGEKREEPIAYTVWHFCDNQEDADTCAELVRSGVKTATTSLLWDYEAEHEPLPQVGDISIITTWRNHPVCIIRTIEVNILQFQAVDEQFAFDEGEGDRSLHFWRTVHWDVFSKRCKCLNKKANEEMPVLCERFQVVYT